MIVDLHCDLFKNRIEHKKVFLLSGGFDPLHSGHVAMIKDAAQRAFACNGKLVVVVNCDLFLIQKKGYAFLPQEERAKIIDGMDGVDYTVVLETYSMYVDEAIRVIKPDYFCNGGDRSSAGRIPVEEREAMEEVGCEVIYGVGGSNKANSSSWIVEDRFINPDLLFSPKGHYARTDDQKNRLMALARQLVRESMVQDGGLTKKTIWTTGWLTSNARIGVK